MISVTQIRKKRGEVRALQAEFKLVSVELSVASIARTAALDKYNALQVKITSEKRMLADIGEQFALNDEESYSQEKLDIVEQEEFPDISMTEVLGIDEETIPF